MRLQFLTLQSRTGNCDSYANNCTVLSSCCNCFPLKHTQSKKQSMTCVVLLLNSRGRNLWIKMFQYICLCAPDCTASLCRKMYKSLLCLHFWEPCNTLLQFQLIPAGSAIIPAVHGPSFHQKSIVQHLTKACWKTSIRTAPASNKMHALFAYSKSWQCQLSEYSSLAGEMCLSVHLVGWRYLISTKLKIYTCMAQLNDTYDN